MNPTGPDERFSNAARLQSEWESFGRRWRLYRRGCLATAVVGLALIFFGLLLPGIGIVAIAVGGAFAWQNFARRERAHWELLSVERTREFADVSLHEDGDEQADP